jgi:hydroxymethylpyrimidine pyrophosphatase-like HAD family hydrolase
VVPGCDSITYDRSTKGWRRDDWFKLVFVSDAERIRKVRHDFERVFGKRFGKASSSARALEVQLARSSKAVGLEKMRRLSPALASRTVIACGDYENDIPMLKAADIAVCPANAMDEVKEICDLVLCDCNEGLIADVIENIEAGKILPKKNK